MRLSLTDREALFKKLATKTLKDGGLTFDFKHDAFVKSKDYWYFPQYPALTTIVDKADLLVSLSKFINDNQNLLLKEGIVFGTWINPQTDKVYIDINTYKKNKMEAITAAKILSKNQGRNIVSLYNPVQDVTEYIEYFDVT